MSREAVIPADATAADVQSPAPARSFVGHAKLIGAITFLSRLLGLAREAIAANYFGSSAVYAAFTLAFTVPNLFRKLLGEGALSSAFIPLYAQAVKREAAGQTQPGEHPAGDFAAASVNLLSAILLGITALGEVLLLAALWLAPMSADTRLACRLTVIMLPYVLLVCGTAFLGSILQVHHRFAAITFTAVVSNVCLIVAMLLAAMRHDLHSPEGQLAAVRWLSYSVLVAGAVQLAILLPSLRAIGFRFRLTASILTPAVRKMLLMTVPVALSAGVLQIGVMLDKGLAFFLSEGDARTHLALFGWTTPLPMAEGATQRLNWAQFMYQFPLGVFAIALATAIFPRLSSDALDEGRQQFKSVLRQGVEAAMFIGLPASVGMVIVRFPAVQLLFQKGNFTAEDTRWVALSTAIYSSAIWAFSLQQILNRAYYALHDTKTPLVWGVVNLLINLVVELPLLFTPLREAGMAVGTLVSFAIQSVAMLWALDRRVGGLGLSPTMRAVGKMLIASGLMWGACVGVRHLPIYPHGDAKVIWAAQLAVLMTVGGSVYFGACRLMGMDVTRHLRRRR